ncbi:MAG TPA: metallophosphoesterase [Chloroflexota bacterium]|jgi:predicted phosphodiesterase|nr:metallophosphoesterase [Chloroflexota bacterium]
MRIAAIYDVHGNLPALDAVLQEIEHEHPDLILVGGDAVVGPMPRATPERLIGLGKRARFIRGNSERELVAIIERRSS